MIMTESLASGLKNRFFKEVEAENFDLKEMLQANMPPYRSKSDWPKVVKHFESIFKASKILQYEGGGSKHPYLMINRIIACRERPLNTWKENCLFGHDLGLSVIPNEVSAEYSGYSIGEHAVARIFLRSNYEHIKGNIGIDLVNRQLIYTPLWSRFWGMLLSVSSELISGDTCYPLIPTPDGLLLCEFDKRSYILEIRTYLSDLQLTDDQMKIKSLLKLISLKYYQSPGSFYIKSEGVTFDDDLIIRFGVARLLIESGDFELLMKTIFRYFDDDRRRVKVRTEIEKIIKRYGSCFDDGVSKKFDSLGARKFYIYYKNFQNIYKLK